MHARAQARSAPGTLSRHTAPTTSPLPSLPSSSSTISLVSLLSPTQTQALPSYFRTIPEEGDQVADSGTGIYQQEPATATLPSAERPSRPPSYRRRSSCATSPSYSLSSSDGNLVYPKLEVPNIEDIAGPASILLKSDAHDKKAVRMHKDSSRAGPRACLRRSTSAPVGSLVPDGDVTEDGENDTSEPADDNVLLGDRVLSEAPDNHVSILRSWKALTLNRSSGKSKSDDLSRYRTRPPLRIWVGNVKERDRSITSSSESQEPDLEKYFDTMTDHCKSNHAGAAMTHSDVHVIALSPTEPSEVEATGSEYLPVLTTAQLIETGQTSYEVIWQENVLKEPNSKDAIDFEDRSNAENFQGGNNEDSLTETKSQKRSQSYQTSGPGLDKVTQKLENWFWNEWTCNGNQHKNEVTMKKCDYDRNGSPPSLFLAPPLLLATTTSGMVRKIDEQGNEDIIFAPPNSVQSSRRSSHNHLVMSNELQETVLEIGGSKYTSTTKDINAGNRTFSPTSSNSTTSSSYHTTNSGSSKNHSTTRQSYLHSNKSSVDMSIPAGSGETKSQKHVLSIAVRKLSNFAKDDWRFRKHRDSLLLTRQRLIRAASVSSMSSIGSSISSSGSAEKIKSLNATSTGSLEWKDRQDSLEIVRGRLDRSRQKRSSSRRREQTADADKVYRLRSFGGLSPIADAPMPK